MENNNDEFKGYSLFNDIEDADLRNRNRSVIMFNILDHNTKDQRCSPKGAALILGYFSKIPKEERDDVESRFEQLVKEKGYVRKAA